MAQQPNTQPAGDLTLNAGQTLGSLTPLVGQPLNPATLAYAMLGVNVANEAYNIDLPLSAYSSPGTTPVVVGAPLVAQGDLAFKGGIAQPYSSASGFTWVKTQTDPNNGFKGGVVFNNSTKTAVIGIAGMDGFKAQDLGSGVVFNGANQFDSYKIQVNPDLPIDQQPQSIRQFVLGEYAKGNFNAETKIVITGQSMGEAIATMIVADLVSMNNDPGNEGLGFLLSQLPSPVIINPANIALIGANGLSVSDSVLQASTGISLTSPMPMPVDDTVAVGAGAASYTITKASLFANDMNFAGDALQLRAIGDAVGGTVALNAQGDIVFTAKAGYGGVMSFTYTAQNTAGHFTVSQNGQVADLKVIGEAANDAVFEITMRG